MVQPQDGTSQRLRVGDIELAYELAFLRVFMAWEVLLEGAFLRFMCGFMHSNGQEPLAAGKAYQPTISDAETYLLNGRQYLLWHNPTHVINRAGGFFSNSRFELILASAQHRVEHFATVRHRIAHSQKDAAAKFDTVSMLLAGKRYMGSRPGRFLRDWQVGINPPQRWFASICLELESLSHQICA
ncbi:hypothetical protein HFO49_32310 [Rhizobium leguminosarum]|uniref:hypothetical protein n=1 Tax=Rhizobium leguminosarum TaxID=384 RepID=UPI001C96210C|nr:hypothetical protein [Rhizobium leguminosarum]MBY5592056.1 hypothetical protein [Rhizobium leguminosarum]